VRVSTALLCDAATVREGLLHILGGGISTMSRPTFPAALGAQLAIMIHQHPTELARGHTLDVIVQTEDGERVANASVSWQTPPELQRQLREVAQPVVLPLAMVGVPRVGAYSVEILIDGIHQTSVPFEMDEIQMPGTTPQFQN
jgi:hypothetical protein